jgi:hypothetical protein
MSTSTKRRRVAKVAEGLSVLEIVLALLRERHRDGTLMAHTLASLQRPKSPTLCDRVEAAVEREMTEAHTQAIRRKVRERCHEALFLVNLIDACEFSSRESRRADALFILAQLYEIELLRTRLESKHGFEEGRWTKKVLEWRSRLLAFLADRKGHRLAINAFQNTYFAGQEILFADTRKLLDSVIDEAERLVGWYENLGMDLEYLHKMPKLAKELPPIAPREIETLAKGRSADTGRILLDTARVDALKAMGMDESAVEVYRPYLKELVVDA